MEPSNIHNLKYPSTYVCMYFATQEKAEAVARELIVDSTGNDLQASQVHPGCFLHNSTLVRLWQVLSYQSGVAAEGM